MGRSVHFEAKELVVKFSGLTMLAGLKSEIRIPYSSITGVQDGYFKLHWNAFRILGTSVPYGYKAGRFIYKGQKYFLSYNNPSQVVAITLKDHDFDKVVIQAGRPKEIKQAILKRCPQLSK